MFAEELYKLKQLKCQQQDIEIFKIKIHSWRKYYWCTKKRNGFPLLFL